MERAINFTQDDISETTLGHLLQVINLKFHFSMSVPVQPIHRHIRSVEASLIGHMFCQKKVVVSHKNITYVKKIVVEYISAH